MRMYWCINCGAKQYKPTVPITCPSCKSIWIIPSKLVKKALKLKLPVPMWRG